jgi:predicted TIM-barrel fold metal-dependent hydrolase
MIIDTHLHIVDQDKLHYPWLGGAGPLNRNFPYDDYAGEAKRLGILAALHMEVDVTEADMEAETRNVLSLAAEEGSLLVGAIANCRPESDGFAAYLERAREQKFIKGFRRILHEMPDNLSESPLFRENIKRLSGTGLTYDIVALPHQLPIVAQLADLAPDVQFVLDHCGVPDIKGEAYDTWANNMTGIAKRPNITGKLSGIVAYTNRESWTLDDIRPYAEHTIGSFGFDRMVWGSDWPVCTLAGTLSTWVAATHALLSGASKEEQQKLLSENAIRLWNLSINI